MGRIIVLVRFCRPPPPPPPRGCTDFLTFRKSLKLFLSNFSWMIYGPEKTFWRPFWWPWVKVTPPTKRLGLDFVPAKSWGPLIQLLKSFTVIPLAMLLTWDNCGEIRLETFWTKNFSSIFPKNMLLVRPTNAKQKGYTLHECWANCVTSPFHLIHDLDVWFSKFNFELAISQGWEGRLTWNCSGAGRKDVGPTMWHWAMMITLGFEGQIFINSCPRNGMADRYGKKGMLVGMKSDAFYYFEL